MLSTDRWREQERSGEGSRSGCELPLLCNARSALLFPGGGCAVSAYSMAGLAAAAEAVHRGQGANARRAGAGGAQSLHYDASSTTAATRCLRAHAAHTHACIEKWIYPD